MKERLWNGLLKVIAFVFVFRDVIKKVLIALILAAAVIVVTLLVMNRCKDESHEVTLEETIASIEAVRPRGEFYVCSSVIEDYAIKRETEYGLFFGEEEHSCVQTMTQKCSYVIDLDKGEYVATDSTQVVLVKLPAVKYVASTQGAAFMSDDSNYWARKMPNTNGMKKQVERQIRERFDTAENRKKAERYAEEAIREVMKKLGFEVEFVRSLERRGG